MAATSTAPRATRRRAYRIPLWFVVPALLIYGIVDIYPAVAGVGVSFTNWDGLSPAKFNGIDNLVRFFHDPAALQALGNTLTVAVVVVVLQNVIGLLLAIGLNTQIKSRNVLRTLFFAPAIMTPVVIAFVWQYIYTTDGALNKVLGIVGLSGWKQSWLGDPHLVLGSIIAVIIWQYAGYSMVIYLAGLQGVPAELLEAASLDGAGALQKFRNVTLPQLAPAVTVSVVLSTIQALKLFDQVYAMTGGGPGTSSQVLSGFQYKEAFTLGQFGYGNMVALIMAVIVAAISIAQLRLLRRTDGGR